MASEPSGQDERSSGPSNASAFDAAPGLLRIAAGAGLRTAGWTVSAYVRAGNRLFQAAVSGESAAKLLQDAGTAIRDQMREVLGVTDIESRVSGIVPDSMSGWQSRKESGNGTESERRAQSLRDLGAQLLVHSADVRYEETAHPAYVRIISELAPDEGRILRLLALEGPQPAIDVRTSRPLVSSQLIAPGLSMIGAQAGARYVDRVPAYLNNLYRLGLIWFSREPVEDHMRYQVLEAQPDVLAAMKGAGRGKIVRRSISLTPFGADFCELCLPLGGAKPVVPIVDEAAGVMPPVAESTPG